MLHRCHRIVFMSHIDVCVFLLLPSAFLQNTPFLLCAISCCTATYFKICLCIKVSPLAGWRCIFTKQSHVTLTMPQPIGCIHAGCGFEGTVHLASVQWPLVNLQAAKTADCKSKTQNEELFKTSWGIKTCPRQEGALQSDHISQGMSCVSLTITL